MGAGILECDVTFTKDLELVCRHAQCAKMTPELKSPEVPMPFNGFSQQDYAQKMIASCMGLK